MLNFAGLANRQAGELLLHIKHLYRFSVHLARSSLTSNSFDPEEFVVGFVHAKVSIKNSHLLIAINLFFKFPLLLLSLMVDQVPQPKLVESLGGERPHRDFQHLIFELGNRFFLADFLSPGILRNQVFARFFIDFLLCDLTGILDN